MSEIPALPNLMVAADVDETEAQIEMSLDNEIVLILAFPNGDKVDRDKVAQLFAIAGAAVPQILDQMEAPSE